MQQKFTNTFFGAIDSDSDLRVVNAEGNYLHAVNIRNGINGVKGSAVPFKGNEEVFNRWLPSQGENTCIGAIEDPFNVSIIYFIHNSLGQHCIFRYWPNRKTTQEPLGVIEPLITDELLNFKKEWLIHGVVIDNFCYWTDAYANSNEIVGNPVRKISLERYSHLTKKIAYNLVFCNKPTDSEFRARYVFRVRRAFTNAIKDTISVTYTGAPNITDFFAWLNSNLSLEDKFEFKLCSDNTIYACYMAEPGFRVDLQIISTVSTPSGPSTPKVLWYPVNYVPNTFDPDVWQLAKVPPGMPPQYFYTTINNELNNFETKKPYQFRYRFVFADGEASAYSEPSLIYITHPQTSTIMVDYTNEYINDIRWLPFIKGVDIIFRESNISDWKLLARVPREEFGFRANLYEFLVEENNGTVVESDGSITGDGQFLKLSDSVPRLASSVASIADEAGNNLLALGGLLQDYSNNIDCVEWDQTSVDTEVINQEVINLTNPILLECLDNPFQQYYNLQNYLKLKSNGIYEFAIVYMDRFQRRSSVVKLGPLAVGEEFKYNGDVMNTDVARQFQFSINHRAPDWAYYWSIYRTKNQHQAQFYQLWVESVNTFQKDADGNVANVVTNEGQADVIRLSIPPYDNIANVDEGVEAKTFRPNTFQNFDIQEGDIVRILGVYDQDVDIPDYTRISTPSVVREYPILRCTVAADGTMAIDIERDPTVIYDIGPLSENNNFFVEIYRPQEAESELYFSTGNTFRVIDGLHQAGRAYDIPIEGDEDQTDTTPAVVTFIGGDTYIRRMQSVFPFDTMRFHHINSVYRKEFQNFQDLDVVNNQDIGVANIYDPDASERYDKNWIRTSDVYVPVSGINGLSSFRELDFIKLNIKFGAIKKLATTHNVMLAVCMYKSQPLYIGKDRMLDVSGQTLVARTQRVLNLADEVKEDFGSFHTESICVMNGYVYAWDVFHGAVWRYASNGQFAISSYGKENYFRILGKNRLNADPLNEKVIGGYQPEFLSYYLSFQETNIYPVDDVNSRNIPSPWFNKTVNDKVNWKFDESKNGTSCEIEWKSEMYGNVGLTLVSFDQGKMYLHESNNVPFNNFNGIQRFSSLTYVVNALPSVEKVWFRMALKSDKLFTAPYIQTPFSFRYPEGMLSVLLENHFKNYEGIWNADFLRDSLDPRAEFTSIVDVNEKFAAAVTRGRNLRGEVLVVTLDGNKTGEYFILNSVDTYFVTSENSI